MPSIKDFKTIIKPIITEKSSLGAEFNQVTFQVNKTSNKTEIKTAIENIIVKGKLKAFRGSLGKRSDYKKAFVTLEEGQTIDLNAGV